MEKQQQSFNEHKFNRLNGNKHTNMYNNYNENNFLILSIFFLDHIFVLDFSYIDKAFGGNV